jgi:hypothetical protein
MKRLYSILTLLITIALHGVSQGKHITGVGVDEKQQLQIMMRITSTFTQQLSIQRIEFTTPK